MGYQTVLKDTQLKMGLLVCKQAGWLCLRNQLSQLLSWN